MLLQQFWGRKSPVSLGSRLNSQEAMGIQSPGDPAPPLPKLLGMAILLHCQEMHLLKPLRRCSSRAPPVKTRRGKPGRAAGAGWVLPAGATGLPWL